MFPSAFRENSSFVRVLIETRLLSTFKDVLSYHTREDISDQDLTHAIEACKVVLKAINKCAKGCRVSLRRIRLNEVHVALVKLLKHCDDAEQVSLLALCLGNLVVDDSKVCAYVLEENCVARLACHLEKYPHQGDESQLKDSVLFFMQSCFM